MSRTPIENMELHAVGDEGHLDFWYPRCEGEIEALVIGLSDVRAADDIRVSYDFDRDGWKIEQASCYEWAYDDKECDPDWQEVAFVKAWAREVPLSKRDPRYAE